MIYAKECEKRTSSLCLSRLVYPKDGTLCSLYVKRNYPIKKKFRSFVDTSNSLMRVNLETGEVGYCPRNSMQASALSSEARSKRQMVALLKSNEFDWFLTLTFDRGIVDRLNDEAVYRAYSEWIRNFSRRCPSLRYITFPEQHEAGGYHFHIVLGGVTAKDLKLRYSGKVCCHWATKSNKICSEDYYNRTKKDYENELIDTDGLKVYNANMFTDGYSTVTRIVSRERCNSYVMKYVEKAFGSTYAFKKRYFYSRNLKKPDRFVDELAELTGKVDINDVLQDPWMFNHPYFAVALDKNVNKHNVAQWWVTVQDTKLIEEGFTPLKKDELDDIF